jgi:hypothetical protein
VSRAKPYLIPIGILVVAAIVFAVSSRGILQTNESAVERIVLQPLTPKRLEEVRSPAHNEFAFRVLDAIHEERFAAVPSAALTRLLLTISNGSQDPTYEKVANSLGFGELGEADFGDYQRLVLDAINEDGEVREAAALWLVWPVIPSPSFAKEMALGLEVDVKKLGTSRIGGHSVIRDWMRRQEPGLETPFPFRTIVDDDPIVANVFSSLPAPPPLALAAPGVYAGENEYYRVIWADRELGYQEAAKQLRAYLAQTGKGAPWTWQPPVGTEKPYDLDDALQKLGFGFLKQDNDLRGISPDLNRRSNIKRVRSQVLWRGVERDRTPPERRGWFIVVEPRTNAILVVGCD